MHSKDLNPYIDKTVKELQEILLENEQKSANNYLKITKETEVFKNILFEKKYFKITHNIHSIQYVKILDQYLNSLSINIIKNEDCIKYVPEYRSLNHLWFNFPAHLNYGKAGLNIAESITEEEFTKLLNVQNTLAEYLK